MNLSINGQSQVPPGFRFHPTEEELLHYYLRKKVASHKIDLDVIPEVDLNKLEPWDIQEKCKIGSTPQSDWYFFSHKDKKYPTGTRTNRATTVGFWKATGRDKIILSGIRRIGLRKTLVFYKGRAPHGQKSDWIMHEYRLDEDTHDLNTVSNKTGEYSNCGEDGWVICRVFKKKNYQKTEENSKASSNNSMDLIPHHHNQLPGSKNDGVLDQILLYMGRKCKLENEYSLMISDRFLTAKNNTNFTTEGVDHSDSSLQDNYFINLPRLLDSPTTATLPSLNITNNINGSDLSFDQDPKSFKACYDQSSIDEMHFNIEPSSPNYKQDPDKDYAPKPSRLNDWVSLDRLVASQLNGDQEDSTSIDTIYKQLSFLGTDPNMYFSCSSSDQDKDGTLSYKYIRSGRSNNQTSTQVYMSSDDNDFWSFTKTSPSPSSSDPLCHLSV